jgi:glycogen debranching enzyme
MTGPADQGQSLRDERALRGAPHGVTHSINPDERLPVYRLAGDGLGMGASFGNGRCWLTTKGRSAIEGLYSTDLGRGVVGTALVRFSGVGHSPVLAGEHKADGAPDGGRDAYVQLLPEGRGEITLHPAYQRHTYHLVGEVRVRQTIFVPRTPRSAAAQPNTSDPAVAYQIVELANLGDAELALRVYGFAQLRGDTDPDLVTRYDAARGVIVAHNAGHPDWVRVFGATMPPTAYETTTDASQANDVVRMRPLTNRCMAEGGHVLGSLQVDCTLAPGARQRFAFIVAFSRQGEAAALAQFDAARDADRALNETIAFYQAAMTMAEVLTPDPVINEGALWAKINMLRVMADYPTGPAFTNDPSRSSAVVGRDAFWFVYGGDHLREAFSCALLDAFTARQESNGKIIEFYNAVTGATDDYGLNINDNTPLYILAVNHHWRATGHRACLERHYLAVARAARYILSQRNAQGLVWCTATGEELHGIIGWRNIIPNYRISGAVTEVNAECAAALRAAGHLAANLGHADDARAFTAAAEQLTTAINTHLINPKNGLYYLNIDVDGTVRTDVTADEVFPVIFRVAPEDVAFRIVSRLNVPDFWTEAGLRTVSAAAVDYDPSGNWGLLGGVWPGVTWWYAFAAARYHPGGMVRALRASFAHYARAPKLHNTVPGQFSEWFDGESLVNRGMRLSPWEAPRFLWAAVEGICGVQLRPEPEPPVIQPLLPMEWKWVALRNLPYHGQHLSYFAARLGAPGPGAEQSQAQATAQDQALILQLYASGPAQMTKGQVVDLFAEDVSERVRVYNEALRVVALARPGEVLICAGNTSGETAIGGLGLDDLLPEGTRYHFHLYNSERGMWSHGEQHDRDDLLRLALQIEAQGFRILRLREEH